MSRDTAPDMQARYRDLLMALTPEARQDLPAHVRPRLRTGRARAHRGVLQRAGAIIRQGLTVRGVPVAIPSPVNELRFVAGHDLQATNCGRRAPRPGWSTSPLT